MIYSLLRSLARYENIHFAIDRVDAWLFFRSRCAGGDNGMVVGTICFLDDKIGSQCSVERVDVMAANMETARCHGVVQKGHQ